MFRLNNNSMNPLKILTKKDWIVYLTVNLIVLIISLVFALIAIYEAKIAEEQRRLAIELAYEQQQALEQAILTEVARKQEIAAIQYKTGLDDEIARKIVEEAGRYESLNSNLIAAVMFVESSYNPIAVSHAGAIGIMQIMPVTGEWLAEFLERPFTIDLLYDPLYNIELACYYLDYLLDMYDNNLHSALTAYNRGPTGLERFIENNQRTSSTYSNKVIELYESFKNTSPN
ncbi:lytic transglycosylase domain-containing protein [Desulfuribacillus alkaliarsenatis]|uniref:Transglycosylase SLT domain-containing protein n=1 Tax=Desulfuribacillus alkaliarsenatis TaxID=766136 RepID=A0A1E5FZ33_9FIRM|nr:lytic transglycosylase domain-containing protein [Desulfuribacillus alkaliarsenatis]OEF95835.1 hypothetical protein BHF68_10585 [Desulfuribacillus alkaliarsenatis]